MSDDHSFDSNRIFYALFIFTALEVAWGVLIPYEMKFALWSGLLLFAFLKGFLIFMYFMHIKFEGWIVKCLIAPTPLLILVIIGALMPDIGANSRMDHNIADQLDPVDGTISEIGHGSRNVVLHPVDGDHEDGGH